MEDNLRVYVRLLGEGIDVYRPATARVLGPNLVKLLKPENYDPEDEEWEFKPGTVVRCEEKILDGSPVQVVVSLVR